MQRSRDPVSTVYVSWNGATEVESWALYAGNSTRSLAQSTSKHRGAFEETFALPTAAFVQVVGLDGMCLLHAGTIHKLSRAQPTARCWESPQCSP
jgi:hypothetical protein